jgi:hypothetical protein
MRQARAQHPHLAGAGDVDQVGLEALQHLADQRNVAQKGRVEAQIFFQGEGEKAARQLQRPHVAVFENGLGAVAGAHAQERAGCAAAQTPQSGGWCGPRRSLRERSQGSRPRAASAFIASTRPVSVVDIEEPSQAAAFALWFPGIEILRQAQAVRSRGLRFLTLERRPRRGNGAPKVHA